MHPEAVPGAHRDAGHEAVPDAVRAGGELDLPLAPRPGAPAGFEDAEPGALGVRGDDRHVDTTGPGPHPDGVRARRQRLFDRHARSLHDQGDIALIGPEPSLT